MPPKSIMDMNMSIGKSWVEAMQNDLTVWWICAVHIVTSHTFTYALQSHVWNSDFEHLIYIRLVIQLGSNLIFFLWSCYFFTCLSPKSKYFIYRVFGCMISFSGRHMTCQPLVNSMQNREEYSVCPHLPVRHSFGILFRLQNSKQLNNILLSVFKTKNPKHSANNRKTDINTTVTTKNYNKTPKWILCNQLKTIFNLMVVNLSSLLWPKLSTPLLFARSFSIHSVCIHTTYGDGG